MMKSAGFGWSVLGALALIAAGAPPRPANAQHQTGFTMIKRCTPNFAYDGATVACEALVQNRDLDHPAVDLAIVNALTTPGPSTTQQPVCNKDLATGLQKFDPATLNFNGDDAMICTFDETIAVAACAPGTGMNFVDDTVTLTGKDGDILPPSQNGHQGEPVGSSASNRVFVACCGDGVLDPNSPETCDLNAFPAGAPATHGACRPQTDAFPCTFCGDGVVQDGEACDDGNGVDTDGCRNDCTLRACGDAIIDGDLGETCDAATFPATAPATHGVCRGPNDAFKCTFCGDGVVQDGETCDDGNAVDTDACRNDCTIPHCGDGILDAGEQCDGAAFPAGTPASHGPCRAAGTPGQCTFCGDGTVEAGEACDDGNAVDTDACKNDCTLSAGCGNGVIDAGETCDGAAFPPNAPASHGPCRPAGSAGECTFCGDGTVQNGETCDDGNAVDTDACSNTCSGICPPFVLLLRGDASLNNQSAVCGSFGVNDAGGVASISRNSVVTDTMAADTTWLKNGASAGRVATNQLKLGKGASVGAQTSVSLPLLAPFCPIPAITCGGTDVSLAKGETRTLAPGVYGAVTLRNGATLKLTPGGNFSFCSIRVARGASVELDTAAASTVDVRDDLDLMNGAFFGPTSGAKLPTVHVGGSGTLRLGAQAILAGFVSAPNASLRFGRGAEVHGSVCAADLPASDKGPVVICPGPQGRTRQQSCP